MFQPNMYTFKRLLSDTLCEKHGSYAIEEIFTRFETVRDLMNATQEEFMQIKGIGKVRARQIVSALQLAKVINIPQADTISIRSPKDAADLLMPELKYLQKEHFVCLFLNTKNKVIGKVETLSIGTLNASLVHPREVFKAAIQRSSSGIICGHQHPSGDPTPSPDDIEMTRRLVEAGDIIGIEVLDHIIIGYDSFVSLKEQGLM